MLPEDKYTLQIILKSFYMTIKQERKITDLVYFLYDNN